MFVMRVARISVLLALVLVLGYACAEFGGRYLGDRIYLRNSSTCTIHLMSEHDGKKAEPGDTVLVKPGFSDKSPSMLIAHAKGIPVGHMSQVGQEQSLNTSTPLHVDLVPAEPLSSVNFVHDYVHLVFQVDGFSLYNDIELTFGSASLTKGAPGFCDALVGLMAQRVTSVEAEDKDSLQNRRSN